MVAGIEASGKTVLLSCLYELYKRPDLEGYFLNPKDSETFTYLESNLSILRNEMWPSATAINEDKLLWLELRTASRKVLCDIPVRDFAGEVYLSAFGGKKIANSDAVANLKRQIRDADILLAIVNLQDLINGGELSEEDLLRNWTTKALFDYVANREDSKKKKLAIVLTKSNFYGELICECGGPHAVVEKYLPSVAYVYENIDVFAVSAVDKVEVNAEGNIIPARDFSSESLRPVMKWIIQCVEEVKRKEEEERKQTTERQAKAEADQLQRANEAIQRGRIWRWARSEYWGALIIVGLLWTLGAIFWDGLNLFSVIAMLFWMWASICRLHDFNCRGWGMLFALFGFIPELSDIIVIFIIMTSMIIGLIPGTKGENRWGING